ncbi:MAG: hypothetical protein CVT84_04310 [Alphaproteobacteria bacterium HGW-Alphaproteobacteria-6]|nr:MAG: hypothetical protein CVT84_04310 [Alphaproteobacteria bacterium HGW-Alphaproteobacteria-6]
MTRRALSVLKLPFDHAIDNGQLFTNAAQGACVAEREDLLIHPDQGQPFPRRLAFVAWQKPIEMLPPRTDPRSRLMSALIAAQAVQFLTVSVRFR